MKAVEALSLIAGHVSDEILLRNEYLAAENEILRSKLGARVPLTNEERVRLAKLGRKNPDADRHKWSAEQMLEMSGIEAMRSMWAPRPRSLR